MQRIQTRDMVQVALFSTLICICSMISIPIFTIPITLQVFGIALCLFALGGKKGSLCVVLYLVVGCIGLPVFAGFRSGPSVLLGPTGGYLYGFLLTCGTYLLWEAVLPQSWRRRMTWQLLGMTLGLFACYIAGSLHFCYLYSKSTSGMTTAIITCVVPYIVPDLIKICLAYSLAQRIKKATSRHRKA